MKNRPAEHARRHLRAVQWAAAKRAKRPIAGLAVILVVSSVGIALLPTFPAVKGFVIGFLAAALLGTVLWVVLVSSGSYGWSLGKMGEEFTAEAVAGPARRRRGWRLVNGVYFDRHGDVDHVLIGPGGVFVIESKFTTSACRVDGERVVGMAGREPISQARDGAEKVQRMLRYGPDHFDVTVRPVVVIWGPGRVVMDTGFEMIGNVLLCDGPASEDWLQKLGGAVLNHGEVEGIESYLLRHVERQVEPAA